MTLRAERGSMNETLRVSDLTRDTRELYFSRMLPYIETNNSSLYSVDVMKKVPKSILTPHPRDIMPRKIINGIEYPRAIKEGLSCIHCGKVNTSYPYDTGRVYTSRSWQGFKCSSCFKRFKVRKIKPLREESFTKYQNVRYLRGMR
jgi:hypothetical protein